MAKPKLKKPEVHFSKPVKPSKSAASSKRTQSPPRNRLPARPPGFYTQGRSQSTGRSQSSSQSPPRSGRSARVEYTAPVRKSNTPKPKKGDDIGSYIVKKKHGIARLLQMFGM